MLVCYRLRRRVHCAEIDGLAVARRARRAEARLRITAAATVKIVAQLTRRAAAHTYVELLFWRAFALGVIRR